MTVPCKAIPIFLENTETRGIITGNEINMPKYFPNNARVFTPTPATTFSNTGANFQASNVGQFTEGNVEMQFTFNLPMVGQTAEPGPLDWNAPGANLYYAQGTSPSLFNGGIQQLALNKLINYISYNISGYNFVEQQSRVDCENIDMLAASGLSEEKLASYGIYPFENQGVLSLRRLYGNGQVTRGSVIGMTASPETVFLPSTLGMESALKPSSEKDSSILVKNIRGGYFTINLAATTFTTDEPGVLLLAATGAFEENVVYPVFASNSVFPLIPSASNPTHYSANQIYYSVRGKNTSVENPVPATKQTLYMNLNFTVREYIISPYLSSPYTHKQSVRSYPNLGSPFSMNLQFNTQFLNNMIIALPNQMNITSGAGVNAFGYGTVTGPPTLKAAVMNIYTFSSAKELTPGEAQRTLFSYISKQNMQPIPAPCTQTTGFSQTVTTSNLRTIPPYILIYVRSANWEQPPGIFNATRSGPGSGIIPANALAPYVLHPLQNIQITYGDQSDVMLGVSLTIKEMYDIMMDTIGNYKLRRLIQGQQNAKVAASLFDLADSAAVWQNVSEIPPINYDQFFYSPNQYPTGLPFLLLETAKLQFKPVSGMKLAPIPEFDYGSDNYRSMQIIVTWSSNLDYISTINNPVQDVLYQPVVSLITRGIRSVSLSGQGMIGEEELRYDLATRNAELNGLITDFMRKNISQSTAHDSIQYIGGVSFGNFAQDLYKKVKEALPQISSINRRINQATRGEQGLLGDINRVTGVADKGFKLLGYGKR